MILTFLLNYSIRHHGPCCNLDLFYVRMKVKQNFDITIPCSRAYWAYYNAHDKLPKKHWNLFVSLSTSPLLVLLLVLFGGRRCIHFVVPFCLLGFFGGGLCKAAAGLIACNVEAFTAVDSPSVRRHLLISRVFDSLIRIESSTACLILGLYHPYPYYPIINRWFVPTMHVPFPCRIHLSIP